MGLPDCNPARTVGESLAGETVGRSSRWMSPGRGDRRDLSGLDIELEVGIELPDLLGQKRHLLAHIHRLGPLPLHVEIE